MLFSSSIIFESKVQFNIHRTLEFKILNIDPIEPYLNFLLSLKTFSPNARQVQSTPIKIKIVFGKVFEKIKNSR